MKLFIILINFAIVLLFLVFVAMFLERQWRQHLAARAAQSNEGPTTGVNRIAESVKSWLGQLRTLAQPTPPSAALVKQFRAWVTRDLNQEQALQSWLLALPEPGLALLATHVVAFCQELNFELDWLLEQQVAIAPELRDAMKAVIIDYCRACQKAIPVQKQAKLFTRYQQLLKNPGGKEEQALARTLYAHLTTLDLASAPDAAFIMATEEERQQQAIQRIQQVATQNWSQFTQALQATLSPNGPQSSNGVHPPSPSGPNGASAPLGSTRAAADHKQAAEKTA